MANNPFIGINARTRLSLAQDTRDDRNEQITYQNALAREQLEHDREREVSSDKAAAAALVRRTAAEDVTARDVQSDRDIKALDRTRDDRREDAATARDVETHETSILSKMGKERRLEEDEKEEMQLKVATFLKMHADQETLDEEAFDFAGQALEALGIEPEQYGPIFQQVMQDPDNLPAYIKVLTDKVKKNASRVKLVGKGIRIRRPDGTEFTRNRFDDNSFEDVEADGNRLVSDILADRRASVSEAGVDPEIQERLSGAKKKGTVVGEERGKREIEGFNPTPKQVRIGTQLHSKAIDEADALISNIEKAIGMVGRNNTGPIQGDPEGKIGSLLAGTVSLNAIIENVKSNEFLNTIAQLKAASKTGATGLGQIAQFEALATSNKRAALDQKQQPAELIEQLNILLDAVNADKGRLDGAYTADYVAPFEEDPFDAEVNAILEGAE